MKILYYSNFRKYCISILAVACLPTVFLIFNGDYTNPYHLISGVCLIFFLKFVNEKKIMVDDYNVKIPRFFSYKNYKIDHITHVRLWDFYYYMGYKTFTEFYVNQDGKSVRVRTLLDEKNGNILLDHLKSLNAINLEKLNYK